MNMPLTRNRAFRRSIHRTSFFVALLLTALGMARASAQFSSGLIDFNYNFANYGYPGYSTGPGAIGAAGDLWNSVSTVDASPIDLETTGGNSTSVAWTISGGGGGSATPYINGTYAGLLQVSTVVPSATLTGLTPNLPYDLYLYETYWGETFSVNGVDFTTPGIRYGTVNSLTDGSEYDVKGSNHIFARFCTCHHAFFAAGLTDATSNTH